jgi:hypothetical protein
VSTATDGSAPPRTRVPPFLLLAVVVVVWACASFPVLRLGFVGDDYQWWQHARQAMERPALLVAPYGGYRPVTTWLLAVDDLLYHTSPTGYHATNLCLQLVAGLVFWAFLARLGCRPPIRAGTVLLWLISPYAAEPAWTVAQRFEPVLLAAWLGLGVLWPRPGERWSRARVAAVSSLALLTAFTKETWVVLPGLVLVFDLVLRRARLTQAVAHAGLVGLAVGVYLGLYFSGPPIAPGAFYGAGLAGAYKVAHAWAVFTGLTSLHPLGVTFGAAELAALAMMAVVGWLAWRWRSEGMAVGLAIYLLAFLPILPVGWMTSRYTTIPLAGFLTAVAAMAEHLGERLHGPVRRVAATGAAALVVVVAGASLLTLRGDLADARSYWALHERLLAQARAFLPDLPTDRILVAVRLERADPLAELSRTTAGIPKTFFVRAADPDTLIDWSALWSYVLDPRGGPLFEDVPGSQSGGGPYAVIGHVEGGFVRLEPRASTAAAEVAAWKREGAPAKLIRPWRP